MLDNLNPYMIIILKESDEESHLVSGYDHYAFSNIHFHDDVNECLDQYYKILASGNKAIIINSFQLKGELLKNEIFHVGNQLGINNLKYDVKQ